MERDNNRGAGPAIAMAAPRAIPSSRVPIPYLIAFATAASMF